MNFGSGLLTAFLVTLVLGGNAAAQSQSPPSVEPPVTIESYYRIKWGDVAEFKRLYAKNHAPLLNEMKELGFIRSFVVHEPATHLAGGPRWDLRVTIVYRDAAAAVSDPEWDRLWEESIARRFSDRSTFDSEERARFGLLEDHWDVIVNTVQPK